MEAIYSILLTPKNALFPQPSARDAEICGSIPLTETDQPRAGDCRGHLAPQPRGRLCNQKQFIGTSPKKDCLPVTKPKFPVNAKVALFGNLHNKNRLLLRSFTPPDPHSPTPSLIHPLPFSHNHTPTTSGLLPR